MSAAEPATTRGEATRQAILNAAERLFLAQGYNGTSMRQIAEGAGDIAVGGIYNHYKSKREIFEALLVSRSPYPKVIALLESIEADTGPQMIEQAFVGMSHVMQQNYAFVQLVVIDIQEHDADTVVSLLSNLLPHAIQFFARALRAPGIRQNIQPFVLARAFVSMLMGYNMTNFVLFRGDLPRIAGIPALPDQVEWQAGVIDILINGIADRGNPDGDQS